MNRPTKVLVGFAALSLAAYAGLCALLYSKQRTLLYYPQPMAPGGEARTVTPAQLGGTRHLSAAQFVHDQRDAIALVASQDRRFTVFAWSPCADQVHGHQVETLLL